MQAYFDYDKLANYVVTLHFSYRMKLYFISAALQVKRVVQLVAVAAAAIRLGKYLHVMAFEGIYAAPMRPA